MYYTHPPSLLAHETQSPYVGSIFYYYYNYYNYYIYL
jgi:hypothetical protein